MGHMDIAHRTARPKMVNGILLHQGNVPLTQKASYRIDPTRTITLREIFVRDVKARFRKLRATINLEVRDNDILGLTKPTEPATYRFRFLSKEQKIASFMDWLRTEVDKGMLSVQHIPQLGQGLQEPWTNLYIGDAYKRGVQRARYEMGKAGMAIPTLEETGGIAASMGTPFHIDRVGMLYIRAFEELKGISASMDSQISRVLAEGMASGDGPRLIARKLNAVISGGGADLGITDTLGRFIPAERRAVTMARTEIIRAHHQAMIAEYENWGLEGVHVQAEWSTAGDDRVCDKCSGMEGRTYSLADILNMIPAHPNCRCIALPTMPEEETK